MYYKIKWWISILVLVGFNACSQKRMAADESIHRILYSSMQDNNFEVYTMDEDGNNVKNISNHSSLDYALDWNQNFILFSSKRDGNEDIFICDKNGNNVRNLTNHNASDRSGSFSFDGKKITFISKRVNNNTEVFTMKNDGSQLKQLTNNMVYCESPIWTKDGKKLIYTKITGPDSLSNGELFMMDDNGQNERRLTFKKGYDSGASLSPDEKTLAFYGKSDEGYYDIFLLNMKSLDITNLTNDAIEDYSPSWSSDGLWLAYTAGTSKNYDIWKINIKTKEKVRLTTQEKRDESPIFNKK